MRIFSDHRWSLPIYPKTGCELGLRLWWQWGNDITHVLEMHTWLAWWSEAVTRALSVSSAAACPWWTSCSWCQSSWGPCTAESRRSSVGVPRPLPARPNSVHPAATRQHTFHVHPLPARPKLVHPTATRQHTYHVHPLPAWPNSVHPAATRQHTAYHVTWLAVWHSGSVNHHTNEVGRQEGHLACKKTEWWDVGVVVWDEVQTCI